MRLVMIAALGIFCSACSVTRRLSQGEYLLQKVRIEDDNSVPKSERITPMELEQYVRQTPNKHFLGTDHENISRTKCGKVVSFRYLWGKIC